MDHPQSEIIATLRSDDDALLAKALQVVGCGILITGPASDLPGPTIRFVNAAMCELTGYKREELVGRTPRVLQGPGTDRNLLDALGRSLRQGRSFHGNAMNYRKDGSSYIVAWIINPIHNIEGAIEAWISVQRDVTVEHENWHARLASEERLGVLVAELQHRTRNLMAIIKALASKTLNVSTDLVEFRLRFEDRINALARVQGLLSRLDSYDRVTFDDLIRTEISAVHGSFDKVVLDGPEGVRLRSSTVQTLALALHELVTNAVKHGALGQPSGELIICWALQAAEPDSRPWLHVDWRERGVSMPPVESIRHKTGEGRELIERSLPYQLGGKTTFHIEPDDIHCTIAMQVSASAGAPAHAGRPELDA